MSDLLKRVIDIVAALATVVAAASLVIALKTYRDQERSGRLQRSLELLKLLNTEEPEDERKKLLTEFQDRWQRPMRSPLTREAAQSFLDISRDPNKDKQLYEKWNVARRHLNRLEEAAFAYVYDLGDRKVLAASVCIPMARSSRYFKELIDLFRMEFGEQHSWQLILKATTMMEAKYGPECKDLPADA